MESYINNIAARATGHIVAIKFEANQFVHQFVHQGDTLVILDDEEYQIKVKQAEADLAVAEGNLHSLEQAVITSISNQAATKAKLEGDKASLEKAQKDYQRFKKMYADSAVTLNQYD